jgi:hypothetical protein
MREPADEGDRGDPGTARSAILFIGGDDTAGLLSGLLDGQLVLHEESPQRAAERATREPIALIVATGGREAEEFEARFAQIGDTNTIPLLVLGKVIESTALRARVASLLARRRPSARGATGR